MRLIACHAVLLSACAVLVVACGGVVEETPPGGSGTGGKKEGGGDGAHVICGAGSVPTLVASGLDGPLAIAVDADSVYVTASNIGGEGLLRFPATGGTPQSLAPSPGAHGLFVDADHAYWVEYDNNGPVKRVPHHGGLVQKLTTTPRGTDIAGDDTSIYWLGTGTLAASYFDGVVMKMPKGGGDPVTLASAQSSVDQLRLSNDYVYWRRAANDGMTELVRLAKSGGPATSIQAAASILGIATDDEHVYWSVSTLGAVPLTTVFRAPHGSSDAQKVAVTDRHAFQIHIAGPCLYMLDTQVGGVIQRVDKEGGEPATFATLPGASHLAIDASSVYVTEYGNGKVWSVSR